MASPPLANVVLLFQLWKEEYCISGTRKNKAPPPLANAYLACLVPEEMCCRVVLKPLGLFGRHILRRGGTRRRRRSQMRILRELFEGDVLLGLAETQAVSVVI
jgi:hypothetical protein